MVLYSIIYAKQIKLNSNQAKKLYNVLSNMLPNSDWHMFGYTGWAQAIPSTVRSGLG